MTCDEQCAHADHRPPACSRIDSSLSVRLSLRGANPAERLALRAGLVRAAAEAWGGMATSGVLVAAVRTGITARLSEGVLRIPGLSLRAARRASR